jgi:hypothetical protein
MPMFPYVLSICGTVCPARALFRARRVRIATNPFVLSPVRVDTRHEDGVNSHRDYVWRPLGSIARISLSCCVFVMAWIAFALGA